MTLYNRRLGHDCVNKAWLGLFDEVHTYVHIQFTIFCNNGLAQSPSYAYQRRDQRGNQREQARLSQPMSGIG